MLVFIVPLQSPQVSSDWGKVSAICERTLRSICRQTSGNFHVYLVCNERPRMPFSHPALTIVEEDFPIPAKDSTERMYDKHQKIKRGLVEARAHAPCRAMVVDADDCVHSGLAEWCDKHPNGAGWYFPDGYIYTAGKTWLNTLPKFDLICGSSAIVSLVESDFPKEMSEPKSNFFLVDVGHFEFRYPEKIGGRKLEPLPFPGAVYVADTGDNYTGTSLKRWEGWRMFLTRLCRMRLLTSRIRESFGLYEIPAGS